MASQPQTLSPILCGKLTLNMIVLGGGASEKYSGHEMKSHSEMGLMPLSKGPRELPYLAT